MLNGDGGPVSSLFFDLLLFPGRLDLDGLRHTACGYLYVVPVGHAVGEKLFLIFSLGFLDGFSDIGRFCVGPVFLNFYSWVEGLYLVGVDSDANYSIRVGCVYCLSLAWRIACAFGFHPLPLPLFPFWLPL